MLYYDIFHPLRILKTPDEIYVDESTEVDRIDGKHEYKITSNQLEVYVGTGLNKVTIPYGILSASTSVNLTFL